MTPNYITDMLNPFSDNTHYALRSITNLNIGLQTPRTNALKRHSHTMYAGSDTWNQLPSAV